MLIKTLLLPHITFIAKIFQCPRKTQMSISKILQKFLWSPSYFEPISRITLSKISQHGGIGMPSSSAWTNTTFLIRFKSFTANPTPNLFWMSYALYNLSNRIRSLYPEMFSNSIPHKPEPNSDWKQILFFTSSAAFFFGPKEHHHSQTTLPLSFGFKTSRTTKNKQLLKTLFLV